MRLRPELLAMFALAACLAPSSPAIAAGEAISVGWAWDQVELAVTRAGETEVRVDGTHLALTTPGEPALPAALVRVPAPEGAEVATFELSGERTSAGRLAAPVAPTLLDAPAIAGGPSRVEALASAYDVPVFPPERVRYLGLTLQRGQAYANFAVYPVVLEEGGRVVLLEQATLRVEWNTEAGAPIPFKSLRDSGELDTPARAARGVSGEALQVSDMPALDSAPVDYLVLTIEPFAPLLQPFLDWKNRSGTPATLRTVSWVRERYPHGVDTQERIRNFIREAYRYWGIRWVLIVGGPDEVPMRQARSFSWNVPQGVDIITDLYYACLDGTWNADGDAVFGEPTRANEPVNIGDDVDFAAEVAIGRIPAINSAQVNNWLAKYFKYAQDPVTDGYLERILLMGEVLFDSRWTRAGLPTCGVSGTGCPPNQCGECVRLDGVDDCIRVVNIVEDALGGPQDDRFIELYEYYEYWRDNGRPNCLLENYATVVNRINEGAGLLHHVGHGDRDRMSIGTISGTDGNGRYVVADARAMSNGDRIGVVYSINCNSAAIDYDCLAEAFLFAENGGMVTYIGSTNLDFPSAATPYMTSFYRKTFNRETYSMGEAFVATIGEQMAGQQNVEGFRRFLAYSLILLGDPQLPLWLATPSPLAVSAATSVPLGSAEPLRVRVTSQAGGGAMAGAAVCAYKDGDAYAIATTDAEGNADLPFRPTGTGTFRITVTHPDAKPHIEGAVRSVTSPAGPQGSVSVVGASVNDSATAETSGNDNGRFELGETIKLDAVLRNGSSQRIDAVDLRLSLGPAHLISYFDILDANASIASINAGATVQVSGAFRLRARSAPAIPDREFQNGDRIPLVARIGVTIGGGEEEVFDLPLPAFRPLIELEQGSLVETAGNGDDVPQNGESFQWIPLLRNRGNGSASMLQGFLTAESGAVVQHGAISLESADRGELFSPIGEEAPLQFDVTDAGNLKLRFTIRSSFDPGFSFFDRAIGFDRPAAPGFDENVPPEATQDAIGIVWTASPSSDVQGYLVERSTQPASGFEQANAGLLTEMLYHKSEGLGGLTRYHFRVAAVDSSGNRSDYSPVVSTTTTPASLQGWPFTVQSGMNLGCPTVENIDGSGSYEIFLTADKVYGMQVDGTEIIDGDGISSTPGVWSAEGSSFWSKPAIGDLDGDGSVEIVAVSRFPAGTTGVGQLYVWNASGDLLWRKTVGASNFLIASPVIANIDADAQQEVVVHLRGALYAWNHDGTPVIPANSDGLLAYVGGANPQNPATWPYTWASPAAADLTGDGRDEIILGLETNLPDFRSRLVAVAGDGTILDTVDLEVPQGGDATSANSSPSLADVDDDGFYEIFIATRNYLWAFWYDPVAGELKPEENWPPGGRVSIPKLPSNWIEPTPAIGDVNGDMILDVVLGAGLGRVVAVRGPTGAALPSFPHRLAPESIKIGSAILAQMDSDVAAEILVGDNAGNLYALDGQTLTQMPGFPFRTTGRLNHGLNLWDINRDGHPNLLIQSDQNSDVIILDINNVEFPDDLTTAMQRNPWTSFRHDARNTGTLDKEVITPVRFLAVEALSAGSRVILDWTVAAEPSLFRVERQGVDGGWALRIEAPAHAMRWEGGYRYEEEADAGRYLYRVAGFDSRGGEVYRSEEVAVTVQPFRLALTGVAPNPFNPRTAIRFQTPGAELTLEIVDLGGRRIRTLVDGAVPAGLHERIWDGRDDQDRQVGSGVYLCRLKGEGVEQSRKMVLLR